MAELLALAGRILGVVFEVLGLASVIRGYTEHTAQEPVPNSIHTGVYINNAILTDPVYGLAPIRAYLTGLSGQLDDALTDILAAVQPVTLPATPPSGWAAPTAEAVWDYYPPTGNGRQAATLLVNAGAMAQNMGAYGVLPLNGKPAFGYQGSWDSLYHPASVIFPTPDWTDIRFVDTRLSWLQRTDLSGLTWEVGAAGEPVALANPGDPESNWIVVCLFSDAEFESWKAANPLHQAPVWPGIDSVTLGTPVALAQGTAVNENCDGLLLEVTTTERIIPYMTAAGYKLYRNLGRVVFISDYPNVEHWQGIPADRCVLLPKGMGQAVGALLSFYTGVTGTVTPWVTNRGFQPP